MIDQKDTLTFAWRIEAGERETLDIPVLDDADDPAAIDGWTVDCVIKDRPGGTVLHTFAGDNAQILPGGVVHLVIPAPVSALWAWRSGWWRLIVSNPSINEDDPPAYRIVQGPVVVDPS
jgi:hypothetical protein